MRRPGSNRRAAGRCSALLEHSGLEFGSARDAEFLHATAKRIGMQVENPGGAPCTIDDPAGLLENCENVVPFNYFQALHCWHWFGSLNRRWNVARRCVEHLRVNL